MQSKEYQHTSAQAISSTRIHKSDRALPDRRALAAAQVHRATYRQRAQAARPHTPGRSSTAGLLAHVLARGWRQMGVGFLRHRAAFICKLGNQIRRIFTVYAAFIRQHKETKSGWVGEKCVCIFTSRWGGGCCKPVPASDNTDTGGIASSARS